MDDSDTSFDLYGDLALSAEEPLSAEEQRALDACVPAQYSKDKQDPELEKRCPSCPVLTEELMQAQCKIAELQTTLAQKDSKLTISIRQNGILLRNLSLLFSTAQAEIQRWKEAALQAGVRMEDVPPLNRAVAQTAISNESRKKDSGHEAPSIFHLQPNSKKPRIEAPTESSPQLP